MTYTQAIDYLNEKLPQFHRVGSSAYRPGLENARRLAGWLGNPHRKYPCIHVAGTNGKGTVSNLLASVLQEAGYRVGLYTSPHLKDFRERIRVNGKMVPEEFVCDFVERYEAASRRPPFQDTPLSEPFEPSFFELTTGMAFGYFALEKVDVAVVETGLGGRLDSTNLIVPEVSVITSISFDHMAILGNTLEAIAGEKAGIIKKGVPVAVGKNPPEVCEVMRREALRMESELHLADEEFHLEVLEAPASDSLRQHFRISGPEGLCFDDLACGLAGYYLRENALTALTALRLLQDRFALSAEHIRRGFADVLSNTGLRGRWETLSTHPLCLCDIGHNEAGIRQVSAQLQALSCRTLHIVFGVVNDKDIGRMLPLMPRNAVYYFTKPSIERALPETQLAALAAEAGLSGSVWPSVAQAKAAALAAAGPDDVVFIGGSNYVVAEAL